MRSTRFRNVTIVAMGAALALTVSACGGSSSGGDSAGSTPASTSAASSSASSPASSSAASGSSGASSSAAGSSGAAGSGVSDADMQALYEQAKGEGKVVLWGGEDPDQMQGAFDEFSKTYPGLTLEFTAVNPDQQASQLVTAQAAGQPLPDIIQGRREFMPTLVDAGLINGEPDWAQYGVPSDIISNDGGIIEYKSLYGLAYNTGQVTDPSTLPTTWEALDDAAWKDKLSVDPRGFPFNILAVSLGEQPTLDYVTSLKATTTPAIIQGSTAGLVKLAAGAQALRPSVLEDVKTQQASGAPLEFALPSPALVQDTLWYLTADSPNKAAATLFALWYTSPDGGQVLTAEQNNRTNQLPEEAEGLDVVTYDTPEDAALVAKVTPEIAAIWGSGS